MNDDNRNLKSEKRLGRGIASLLTIDDDFGLDDFSTAVGAINDVETNKLRELSIDDVLPNPNQPRKNFNNAKLRELSESIKSSGLLQPILVSKIKDGVNDGKYMIIAGERRYRASKMAGLTRVKAIVLDLEEQEILKNAILENVQREDLNPIEEALGYKKIIDTFGYTHEQLAKEIGKSRAYITNLLRILNLPEDVKDALENENITLGHAKVLLSVANPEDYLQAIIEKQLSVRQLANMISGADESNNVVSKEHSVDVDDNTNDNVADVTFEMIKQLYSPLTGATGDKNNSNDENNNSKNNFNNLNNEEWKQIERNIKIIEKQLSESCGFDVHLSLKRDGSGKFEISFNDSGELLDLVKLFQ